MPTFPLAHGRLASLRFAFLFFSLIGAGALTPLAQAQVRYTGTAAAQNFGSQAVSVTSAAVSFPFAIAAGTTVGSIAVMTQGSPNLDFASVSGTTCAAQTYASARTCTVRVIFSPKFPGYRMGAIVFFSGDGNAGAILAKVPVYGVGTGVQISYLDPAIAIGPMLNGASLASANGVALDGSGDLFITDGANNRVVEAPVGGGAITAIAPTVNGLGLNQPTGVAVDGAGDLFIADWENSRVVEVPAGGGAAIAINPTVNSTGLSRPLAVGLDGAGDLFIADEANNRVVEVMAGGGNSIAIAPTVDGQGLNGPSGVAIDGAGDLFIADRFNNRVVEVPAGGGAAIAVGSALGMSYATGVAVDPPGDLFIADQLRNRVLEIPAGGGSALVLDPAPRGEGLNWPFGLALDAAGDLFIGDFHNNRVVELPHAKPPALSFPTETPVGSIDSTDGPQTVAITNIGNEPLTFSALSYPTDFSEPAGGSQVCSISENVAPGQQCQVAVQFSPANSGMLNEDVALTDNALNGTGHQSIVVSGTGTDLAFMTSPAPGATLPGSTATLSWHAGQGAAGYAVRIGTGLGGNNLYQSPTTTATSLSVTGLPTLAQKVYLRLSTKINGVWQSQDYIYYEAGTPVQAELTSPATGSAVGPNTTFAWSAGTAVTEYFFQLGTHGPGSYDLLNTGATTALSATGPPLASGGGTIYARLGSKINGSWQSEDYTFSAYTLAGLTTPQPETTFSGSTVTFTWIPGNGVSEYALRIGTGQGANNIYQSPNLTGTSLTVTGIPTTGATIWVRLNSKVNGEWLYQDYTYTEF